MTEPAQDWCLRPAADTDEDLLHDIFASTWESGSLTLPEPILATHFLRIQHIAQERRFATRFPQLERYIVISGGHPAGRLYLQRTDTAIECVDITLLPEHRNHGLGTELIETLFEEADLTGRRVTLQVPCDNRRAISLYEALGFTMVAMDDQDRCYERTPRVREVGTCSSHSTP